MAAIAHPRSIALPSVSVLFSLLLAAAGLSHQSSDEPRAIVREATLAVEGDSAAKFLRRWDARLRRNPQDRAAHFARATLARLTYDYDTADRIYRSLFAPETTRPDGYAVYARLGYAQGLELRSYTTEALPQFEQARSEARAAGDRLAEGETLLWLATSRRKREGLDVETALLDTAAQLIPQSERSLHAQRNWRIAIVDALRGKPAEASANANTSITLARAAKDLRTEADGHRVLGQVLQYRGQWDSALVALREAENVYRRARCGCSRGRSLIWQAQVLSALGRFGEMREVIRTVMAEGERTRNPGVVASGYRAYAVLSTILGDRAAAHDYTQKGMAVSKQVGDSTGVAIARGYLAELLLSSGELAEARRLMLLTLEKERRASNTSGEFAALRGLAAIAAQEKNWPAVESHMREARALLPKLPGINYKAWLMHDEGRLAVERGDLATAEENFQAYLALSTAGVSDVLRYDVRARLADVYVRRGDITRAEQEIIGASDDHDSWRARLTDAELRTIAFQVTATHLAAATEMVERDARIARVLYALAHAGKTDVALRLAERRRARELQDRLLRADALRTGCPANGCAATHVKAQPQPATARELAAFLPDDRTAVLEFAGGVSRAPTTVFVLQRSGVTSVSIPQDDALPERVARLAALVESGADASTLAHSLGSALLEPALARLASQVNHLIIVADGALHQLPWDVLRLRDNRFAAERFAISIAPSAALAATLRRNTAARAPTQTAPVSLLAFADPQLRNDAAPDFADLPRLRASAREARNAARYAARSVVRLRGDATGDYLLRSRLDQFRIIHFATHAVVDENNATSSALVLAPGTASNGRIGPGDLAALHLNADLVILSACRSARGVVVGGEGLQGLTGPLLQAGASAVLATHWRIHDRSTVAFIDDVYEAIARGKTIGDALHAAKSKAIRAGVHPRVWAAFTLVGDPFVTIPLQRPRLPFRF